MRRSFALMSLLAASAVQAQSVTEFTIDATQTVAKINRTSCTDDTAHTRRLRVTGLSQPTYDVQFAHYPTANGNCPTNLLDPFLTLLGEPTNVVTTGGVVFEIDQITLADLVGESCDSESEGARKSVQYCVLLIGPTDVTNATLATGMPINFDTALPDAPTKVKVVPGDGRIDVTATLPTAGDDSLHLVVGYRKCPAKGTTTDTSVCGATAEYKFVDATSKSVTLTKLKNDVTYELTAHVEDDFGNVSEAIAVGEATPADTQGALELYNGAENPLSFAPSCTSTTPWSLLSLLPALLAFGAARQRRRVVAAAPVGVIGALWLTLAMPAHADLGQMTIGLGLTPYKPAIDSERVGGKKIFPIYDCVFDDATLFEVAGDVDTHLFDGFGSLQFGMGFSFAQAGGFAQPASTTKSCGKATTTAVQLSIAKVKPSLIYRFDPLLDAFGFPLVPYARVGLVAAGYAFTKDGAFDSGGNPLGMRLGYDATLGMMLALDFLDSIDPFVPDATRRARANGVFDHTFMFVEGGLQSIDTFGQPGLILTPVDVLLGTNLPLALRAGVALELL